MPALPRIAYRSLFPNFGCTLLQYSIPFLSPFPIFSIPLFSCSIPFPSVNQARRLETLYLIWRISGHKHISLYFQLKNRDWSQQFWSVIFMLQSAFPLHVAKKLGQRHFFFEKVGDGRFSTFP